MNHIDLWELSKHCPEEPICQAWAELIEWAASTHRPYKTDGNYLRIAGPFGTAMIFRRLNGAQKITMEVTPGDHGVDAGTVDTRPSEAEIALRRKIDFQKDIINARDSEILMLRRRLAELPMKLEEFTEIMTRSIKSIARDIDKTC